MCTYWNKQKNDKTDSDIFLVMGGFHLNRLNENRINAIVSKVQELGVKYVAPSHCTGNQAIHILKSIYNSFFIKLGVGKTIDINNL
ncbi:MAG: hypothetical protein FH753_13130 [Firmicutes bacterium]|nr:hypothetical protein [Bacillota bacterium]